MLMLGVHATVFLVDSGPKEQGSGFVIGEPLVKEAVVNPKGKCG